MPWFISAFYVVFSWVVIFWTIGEVNGAFIAISIMTLVILFLPQYFESREDKKVSTFERVLVTAWLVFRRTIACIILLLALMIILDALWRLISQPFRWSVIESLMATILIGGLMFFLFWDGLDSVFWRGSNKKYEKRKQRYGWK